MTQARRPKSVRYIILNWHHRVGAIISLFIILIASTGIALNHTDDLTLDAKRMTNPLILSLYGITFPNSSLHFRTQDHWLTLVGSRLYFDSQAISSCTALIGFSYIDSQYVAACENQLLLLTESGDVIESITESQGLPIPVTFMGVTSDTTSDKTYLKLATQKGHYLFDLAQFSWMPLSTNNMSTDKKNPDNKWSQPTQATNPNLEAIESTYIGEGISVERFLLDIHSGRLFGFSGVIFNDLLAILLIFLALSGFWAWNTRRLRLKRIQR